MGVGILCDPCKGKGWVVFDFCEGQNIYSGSPLSFCFPCLSLQPTQKHIRKLIFDTAFASGLSINITLLYYLLIHRFQIISCVH